jgi:predicted RNase H-like HicB family nuclease
VNQTTKNLAFYKRLPYTLRVEPVIDPDDGYYWTAQYIELRGCKTDGTTETEAVANVQELFDEYIMARIERGSIIPEPPELPATQPTHIWMVVAPRQSMIPVPSSDVESTQETRGQRIPEMLSAIYDEAAEPA